jgi:hypothetical protein
MKKYALIIVAILILIIAFAFYSSKGKPAFDSKVQYGPCNETCAYIQSICGNIVKEESCLTNCQVWTEEMREAIKGYDDCQFLVTQLGLELKENLGNTVSAEDCSLACENYTTKCLSTMENADAEMLQEGFQSCMASCGSFDQEIVDCVIGAATCDDMVRECGL